MKIEETKSRKPSEGLYRKRDTTILGSKFSLYSSANKEELYHVDVEKIKEFEGQAREYFDEDTINSLAKSIKEHGIRSPLTLLRKENEVLEVVSGERRLRAAKIAGLKKIPAFILDDKEKAENIAVIENVQREDLHPIEFGQACKRLIDKGICSTMQEISDNLGVSKSVVVESIGYLEIPEGIRNYLLKNKIASRSILRSLKNKTLSECKFLLGIGEKSTKPFNVNRSIMRVDIRDDKISVSLPKKELLSPELRKSLKYQLEQIVKNL